MPKPSLAGCFNPEIKCKNNNSEFGEDVTGPSSTLNANVIEQERLKDKWDRNLMLKFTLFDFRSSVWYTFEWRPLSSLKDL